MIRVGEIGAVGRCVLKLVWVWVPMVLVAVGGLRSRHRRAHNMAGVDFCQSVAAENMISPPMPAKSIARHCKIYLSLSLSI